MRSIQCLRGASLILGWMLLVTGAFAGGNDTLSTSSGCAIRKFWNISTGGVKDTLFVAPGGRFSIGFTHQVQYNTSQCQSSAGNAASYIVAINGGTGTNYSYAYLLLSDVVTPGARRGPTDFMLNIVAPTTAGYYYLNPATVLMPLTQSTVGQHATATQPAYEANTITILAVGTPSNGNNTPPPTSGKTYTYAVNSCITQTVNNVMLNGMRDTLFTTPGANLSVAFDWSVQYANSNCMSTSSVITYANGLEHYTGSCIQQGYFSPGTSRTQHVSYSASVPSTPGTYYLNLGTTIGGSYTCTNNASVVGTVPLGRGPSTIGVVVVTASGGGMTTTTTTNSGNYWQPNSNGIYFNGGNVGINTTTTNSKLDVNGSIAINHVQVIDGGGRWTGQPITGNENVTPRLSGNGNNIPLDIAQQGASNGQVLKWNGASWAPGTDNGGSGSYSAGNGLTLSGNTFSANSNSPIWNANQLQSIPVMNITPLNGQFLSYSSGQWFPNDLPTPVFRAGPGITTDGNLISAQTTNPLWNANSLNSRALPQGAPQVGQSLVYQQNGWTYSAVGGQDYNSGTGIAISGNTISAQTTNPLWNANSLNSRALPQGAPQVGQSLVYQQNGWTYGAVGGQDYNAGTGIAISGNTISAQNENPIWNAAVLNSKPLPQGSPQTGESLLFGISGWEYDTVGGQDYDAGIGLVITGNLIAAQNSNPIWNSNSLNSRPLPTGAPQTGESLVYGVNGWEYDTVGGQDYDAGIGLVITGNLIAAQNSNPIWNANSLDSRPLPSGIPLSGQSLVYRNGGWGYETIAPDYVAGSGISISNNVIQAENTEPIWNANQLSGHNVGTISPENGQVLQYNGVAWVPGDIAQSSAEANGWETDTLPGGVVNLLTSVNGAVGIGTENPQAELDVFGGIAVKGILVVNDSGQWVGPVVIDSATQAMMDTMAAQQAAIHASMEELKHAQDSLSAGIAIINQGADVIKQGDSLLQVATTQADSAAAQAMIALGQGQIEAGQATVDAGQAQSSAAQADMAATISGLSATLSAASAAISAASATAAALAAIEASAAAAEASIAAGEATIAAAEATGAAVEASLAALEASGAAGDASADAADASADAATASRKAADAKDSADDAKDSADKAKEYAEGNVGGDLSGNMPNPTVAKIQGHAVSSTAPTANKVLKYINNQWQPSLDSNTTYRAGTGIVIRHDSIFAQNSSPMWNANKLQGWALSGTAPAANQVLKWRNNAWIPANDSSATYKGGLGILVRRDSIFAKNDSAIWNATKLRGRAISANAPATNQVLKWRNNAWIPANDSSVTYKAGTGIAIRQDSIFAQNGSAIWNASKLQGFAVADSAPASQQVLKFLDGKWKPAVDSVVHYKGGTGIVVQRDSIFARADSAIWNSNALMGYGIDTLRPDSGQALVWNGQKWQPQRFAQSAPQGWAIDTMAGDTIMYATIPGNIGIGTTRPTQKLMVQGGSTGASDSVFVVNSEGRVGIGTANPSDHFKLSVNGAIRAKKVVVESGWADYVFDEEYSLRPLPELRKYIAENHHLPGVESADAIAENGLDLAKTQQQMMEKIEELTLYLLQIEEQNSRMAEEIQMLKSQLSTPQR